MSNQEYVHGYSEREKERLQDQADTLTELLHNDTRYPAGATVLEAGCGVGAQTVILAKNSPHAKITSVDISETSLAQARKRILDEGITNVVFEQADLFRLPFPDDTFDHIFVCFVLEHLTAPCAALTKLHRVLKPGGTITVIEGDHGSTYFYPESAEAMWTIDCLVELQARMGGNSLIGRQIYPLMTAAGYRDVKVSPRMVYVDASRPNLVEGFIKNTFTAMVEGVKTQAIKSQLIDPESWQKGIDDLYRTAQPDGTFCYTFFKGLAVK